MTQADVEVALARAYPGPDGLLRGSASLFLPGDPLGPFTYEGTRSDDPNDIIPHEDRRELRGSRILGAWLNHFDAREQNTFTTFIREQDAEKGYVQHHIIDFGDCLGSRWQPDSLGKRLGHSYYFDIGHILKDFFTLGLIQRPWDTASLYKEGPDFNFYDVKNFTPEKWKPGYPNEAFLRMQDADAFWGTKIVSRFSERHIAALLELAHVPEPRRRYLLRTLVGRRDKIVHHYFGKVTPLDFPRVEGDRVCLSDLYVEGGYGTSGDAFYEGRAPQGDWLPPKSVDNARICFPLEGSGNYRVLETRVRRAHQSAAAKSAKFHFARKNGAWRTVGIQR